MEESAIQQFQQLGGIGTAAPSKPAAKPETEPGEALPGEGDQPDRWRMLLVELAYLLNGSFRDAHYWEGVKAEKDTFRQLVRIFDELDQKPGHGGTIQIHHRGSRSGKISENIDYVVTFDDVTIDVATITSLTKRMGLRVKHLEGRISKSFECFADQGIHTLTVTIPDQSDQSLNTMRISLRVLSCYNYAVDNDSAIEFVKDDQKYSLMPICNELNQPDPNLTLVAALNNLSSDAMRNLVQKVNNLIKAGKLSVSPDQPVNIYHAIFKIKSLQQKLLKPPIEIGSDTSTASQTAAQSHQKTETAGGAASQSDAPDDVEQPSAAAVEEIGPTIDPGIVKARVAQFAKEAFGSSPQNARQTMKGIFGGDYNHIGQEKLEERLVLITDLIRTMEQNPKGQEIMQAVMHRIQRGIDQVPAELLDDVVVADGKAKFWSDNGETTVSDLNENVLTAIDTAKQRTAEKKKMRAALNPAAEFDTPQYETMAKNFDISADDAEDIVQIFRNCFDYQGNFLRAYFEQNLEKFARYETKGFNILWEFLKETPRRSDRLPFLNSLQLLIKRIRNPIRAIKILLADFIVDPANIEYWDRNAMMLANQFLRTYNKEINMDIEITPEEVLLVKEGLDSSVVNYAKWKVNGEQKQFFEKIVTIRKKLLQSLDPASSVDQLLPIRFLLALEREVHIFLALVGGNTAHTAIEGALKVYGNPASQVYLLKESLGQMPALLQHLAVLIRGFGRVGNIVDLALLEEIKSRQQEFINLAEDARHDALIKRIMGWIDAAESEIRLRNQEAP
ncbi:MAG: hypothetical protein PVF56_03460 [Desulfobacterales bacterium]|jgi:hypothetical protein